MSSESKQPRVFISYASEDDSVAHRLQTALREGGIHVWRDKTRLKIGDPLPRRITKALYRSDFVIILWSKHAEQSNWVDYELNHAIYREIDRRCSILPISLDKTDRPLVIRNKLFVDLCDLSNFDSVAQELLGSIRTPTVEGSSDQRLDPPTWQVDTTLMGRLVAYIKHPAIRGFKQLIADVTPPEDIQDPNAALIRRMIQVVRERHRNAVWRRVRQATGLAIAISVTLGFFSHRRELVADLKHEIDAAQTLLDQGYHRRASDELETNVLKRAHWWLGLKIYRVKASRLLGDCSRMEDDFTTAGERYNTATEELLGQLSPRDDSVLELVDGARKLCMRLPSDEHRREYIHILRGKMEMYHRQDTRSFATVVSLKKISGLFETALHSPDMNGKARVALGIAEVHLRNDDFSGARRALKSFDGLDQEQLSPLIRARGKQLLGFVQDEDPESSTKGYESYVEAICMLAACDAAAFDRAKLADLKGKCDEEDFDYPFMEYLWMDLLAREKDECDLLLTLSCDFGSDSDIRRHVQLALDQARCYESWEIASNELLETKSWLEYCDKDEPNKKVRDSRKDLEIDLILMLAEVHLEWASEEAKRANGLCPEAKKQLEVASEYLEDADILIKSSTNRQRHERDKRLKSLKARERDDVDPAVRDCQNTPEQETTKA